MSKGSLYNHCVIYARVSSKEQEQEGYSIPAQLKLLREYAQQKQFIIAAEFIEVQTAKKAGRVKFEEMLDFLKSNTHIKILLVEKTDRLTRNFKDAIKLEELNIERHMVKENFILSTTSRSADKLMNDIRMALAKNYIDNLSEETIKGMQTKAEHGIWPTYAPFGYKNVVVKHSQKVIVIDEDAALVVKKLFDYYATGNYSLKGLTSIINKLSTLNNILSKSNVHKILQNRIYIGDVCWKGNIYKGLHQPIIDLTTWQRVQELLRKKLGNKQKKLKHTFLFSGLIICNICNHNLIGDIKKKKYIYYRCAGCTKEKRKPYVKQEILENKIINAFKNLQFPQHVLELIYEAFVKEQDNTKKNNAKTIAELQMRYNKLSQRMNKMYMDKLDGNIPIEFFKTNFSELQQEQTDIMHYMEKYKGNNIDYFKESLKIIELAQSLYSLYS